MIISLTAYFCLSNFDIIIVSVHLEDKMNGLKGFFLHFLTKEHPPNLVGYDLIKHH